MSETTTGPAERSEADSTVSTSTPIADAGRTDAGQEGQTDQSGQPAQPDLFDTSAPPAPDAAPAPRRRRGGRRVVRGAGAAGASLELQVEEKPVTRRRRSVEPAPEPESASEPESAPEPEAASQPAPAEPVRPSRSRRRRVAVDEYEDDMEFAPRRRSLREDDDADYEVRSSRRSRRSTHDDMRDMVEDEDERAFDALDNLPEELADRSRPMTSLLFQEPVLPARRPRPQEDDHRSDQSDRSRDVRSRSSRQDQDDRQRDDQTPSDQTRESNESARSRRGNRRLNAQERRAAAEVEQIEEDLELDDITYAPITEEDLSEGPVRSRRRRRRGTGQTAAADASERTDHGDHHESADASDDESSSSSRHQGEDDGQTVTRRRRRRRNKSEQAQAVEAHEDQILARRSRKQQYIDEITDIEGSTRLEAKKQRRRDNRRERSRQSQLMEQDFLARRENVERLMVVREKEHHTQISVVEDNVLVEHYVSDIQEVQTVGNIYLGRVQNVLPSMEAAFVDIGQARNGVLYAGEVNWDAARLEGQPRRIELAFKSGDPVLVQVTKDPIGHKGARLTSQVTLAGRFLVLVPSGGMTGVSRKLSERERSRLKNIVSKIAPKDMGVIIRTAAGGASEEAIVKDLENLVRQWEHITAKRDEFLHGKRPKLLQGEPDVAIRVVRDIFNDDFTKLIVQGDKVYERIEEYLDTRAPDLKDKLERWDPAEHGGKDVFDKWQIDSQLRKGMERQVYLPSGGSIVIDRTEAMTTIDVNTGRFIGKGKSLEETVTRCNLEASEEIARQLRLRDIGGMVMIDYVDMVMPANRDLVLRRLVECLARDRTKHQVAEVTSLGLVQMTRKRIGQGLVEAFSEECPTCKGRGFILHDEPTVSADYDDPYALRGGDPFVKTNKHGRGTSPAPEPAGSSPDVKAKLAQIAAAAVAANNAEHEQHEA